MRRAVMVAAAAMAAVIAAPALADVKAGIEAWQRGDYAAAIKLWEPAAKAGDADAQFNLAQAYKLGRGVPQDLDKAAKLYLQAANQGHAQAQANYGLILFQKGDRAGAMPWLQKAADQGEPRAQYVVGTALFNGDAGVKDWPRAYAYMTRAAAAGLPQAQTSLGQMDQYLSPVERQKGVTLAQGLAKPAPVVGSLSEAQALVTAGPTPSGAPVRPAIAEAALPPSQPSLAQAIPPAPVRAAPARPAAPPRPVAQPLPAAEPGRAAQPKPVRAEPAAAPKPALVAAAGGKWRVQLGAFSSPAAAEAAWGSARAALGGLQHFTVRAGAVTRLQAGPFASRAAAEKGCAAAKGAGLGCFAVAAP